MFFMLPIRTSIRPRKTPYANYGLIAVNVIIFILSYSEHINPFTGQPETLRPWAEQLLLTSSRPYLWQFISYAFLHANFTHILGNMFFLYLFGNNINDKLGNIGYLAFYLAGCIFSAIGHLLLGGGNVLGASGGVAAVTGAYLVLFPQTLITVFYWFIYFINTFEISALYFIGFKLIVWDNMLERSFHQVAYDAHLSGYAFGILSMVIMLATGLISVSNVDLWMMIRQWNRRRRYRDAVSGGYDPFTGRSVKKIRAKQLKKTPAQKKQMEKIELLRSEIATRITEKNLPAATDSYLKLIDIDSEQILPRQYLLDIANQLTSQNNHSEAAIAYEKFLSHYPKYEYIEQVQLMLGIIYARYLDNSESAVSHLSQAAQKLADPGQLKMCNDELEKLQNQGEF